MEFLALGAPLVVLALMPLMHRFEQWALEDRAGPQRRLPVPRRAAVGTPADGPHTGQVAGRLTAT